MGRLSWRRRWYGPGEVGRGRSESPREGVVSNFDQSANCEGVHAGIGMMLGHGRTPMSETNQFWQYVRPPDWRMVFAWLVLTFVATVIYFFPIAASG
jgi:hypothetical protein